MTNNTKTKKISIATFDKIMKDTYTPTVLMEWHGVEITIKPTLSFTESLSFVDNITKTCFTTDQGVYLPEIKEFITKCCILEMYANFRLPSNVEHKYDLVYCTDAVSAVVSHINKTQLTELIDAVNDKIDNIVRTNIEGLNKQMNELYTTFVNLQEKISGIFADIGTEEMSKLVGAISNGQFDESKLAQAYIDNKNGVTKDTSAKDGEV